MSDLLAELDAWLHSNWDPDLTVSEWWTRLGTSGWAAPSLPPNAYGKGVSRNDAIAIGQRIVAHGAVPAPGGLGMLLLARDPDEPRLTRRLLVLLVALVFAQVMIEPHAQPIPIWTARRALTVVLPGACLGLALQIGRAHV